jgi:hypothetical protein
VIVVAYKVRTGAEGVAGVWVARTTRVRDWNADPYLLVAFTLNWYVCPGYRPVLVALGSVTEVMVVHWLFP